MIKEISEKIINYFYSICLFFESKKRKIVILLILVFISFLILSPKKIDLLDEFGLVNPEGKKVVDEIKLNNNLFMSAMMAAGAPVLPTERFSKYNLFIKLKIIKNYDYEYKLRINKDDLIRPYLDSQLGTSTNSLENYLEYTLKSGKEYWIKGVPLDIPLSNEFTQIDTKCKLNSHSECYSLRELSDIFEDEKKYVQVIAGVDRSNFFIVTQLFLLIFFWMAFINTGINFFKK